jgi:hypothetical protein
MAPVTWLGKEWRWTPIMWMAAFFLLSGAGFVLRVFMEKNKKSALPTFEFWNYSGQVLPYFGQNLQEEFSGCREVDSINR